MNFSLNNLILWVVIIIFGLIPLKLFFGSFALSFKQANFKKKDAAIIAVVAIMVIGLLAASTYWVNKSTENSLAERNLKYPNLEFQQAMDEAKFVCTTDCSGHKAGYDWAKGKGLKELEECGGKSQAFKEGCLAYVYYQKIYTNR